MGVIMKSGVLYAGGSGSPSESNYGIVQNSSQLPSTFSSTDRKVYYVVDEETFYDWNGSSWTENKTLKQYDTMPTASSSNLGEVVQYIGLPDGTYSQGSFYKCEQNGSSYRWTAINAEGVDELTPAQVNSLIDLL